MLFRTTEGNHGSRNWAPPASPAEVTEEHKLHSRSHLHSRRHIPQTGWFPAAYTNPARDGAMGVRTQSAALTPSCWSLLCPAEPIATVAESERANLDSSRGDIKSCTFPASFFYL